MIKLLLIFLLNSFSFCTYANICPKLLGQWKGDWQDQQHKMFATQISIAYADATHFQGKFTLSDGSIGTLNGTCKKLNSTEAYLILRKEAPWFNPCRGTLLQVDNHLMIHFYCFKPNQSGYVEKL